VEIENGIFDHLDKTTCRGLMTYIS